MQCATDRSHWHQILQNSRRLRKMSNKNQRNVKALGLASWLTFSLVAWGQSQSPLGYSVATPRPINPAEGTTTPSAQATQRQNPYLGSVPSKNTGTRIELSLRTAIERGLRYNLGLVEANETSADVRAERLRALSALLPQLAGQGRQVYENLSYKEIGLKLPPIPGLPALPSTSGGFGYQDARVSLTQSLYNAELRNRYGARKSDERASILSIHDSRDVVVFAVGTAYMQVLASAAPGGAEASVQAAVLTPRAQKAQRLPVVSVTADYGGGGANIGNFNQVYTVAGNISVPIYTGGRIRADIQQAQADLARREAEYEDLKGRVSYDVRVACLDLTASDSSVRVAERNKSLAERALTQSQDRYSNGVNNYLEVVQTQVAVNVSNEHYIQSLFSLNVAMISFARAVGSAETRLPELLGGK